MSEARQRWLTICGKKEVEEDGEIEEEGESPVEEE